MRKKVVEALKKMQKKGIVTTLALIIVGVSELSIGPCGIFYFGQEDMPEELL